MTENRSQTTALAGIFLLLAFLLPSLVSLHHAAYEHQDISCTTNSGIHIHEAEFSCNYDDFILSTLILEEQIDTEMIVFPGFSCLSEAHFELYLSPFYWEQNQRGPPPVLITRT